MRFVAKNRETKENVSFGAGWPTTFERDDGGQTSSMTLQARIKTGDDKWENFPVTITVKGPDGDIVINTDKAEDGGTHWINVYHEDNDTDF